MKHDFIDKYCHLDSPLHRLDPRTKLLLSFLLLLVVIATPRLHVFIFYYALIFTLAVYSKVPLSYFLKRALLVTPIAGTIAVFMLGSAFFFPGEQVFSPTDTGHPVYLRVALILLKTYASVTILTLLTSVTRFNCLLWSMRKLRLPAVITTLSKLIYTYTFILVDELHAVFRSLKSRAPVIRMPRTKVYGNIAASILLKSIQRSRMVYFAMVSRQFSGEFPEGAANRFGRADLAASTFFILVLGVVYILWNL